MIEKDISIFREKIQENKNKSTAGLRYEYEDAIEKIREILTNEEKSNSFKYQEEKKDIIKDKKYIRNEIEKYKENVLEVININNIKIKGYDNKEDLNKFAKEVAEEMIGFDVLADAYNNPNITDIYVITWDNIFVEENGENKEYLKKFRSSPHLEKFISNLTKEAGKQLDSNVKKLDFELYGDRYCATHPALTPKGYSLTVRKHAEEHIKFKDLLKNKLLSDEIAEFIRLIIKGERNIVYAGITGSGKTTSIRAFLDHYVPQLNKRMTVAEDTQELFLQNKHTLEMVSTVTGSEGDISLQQIIYTFLRLKPKYIVVGEVRAEEAQAASEAMETGHSTILTMHGGRAINVINRFVTKYLTAMPTLGIEVVERIVGSAIDYIFIQDNVPSIGRRITEVSEICYDYTKRTIDIKPIYKFDIKKQQFLKLNNISEEKIEMMLRRGVKPEEIEGWEKKEVITND